MFLILSCSQISKSMDFPGGSAVRNQPAKLETGFRSLGPEEDPLEKKMATHSSILAWETPWTEELGGLQSMGSQSVEYNLRTKQQQQDFKKNVPRALKMQNIPPGLFGFSFTLGIETKD